MVSERVCETSLNHHLPNHQVHDSRNTNQEENKGILRFILTGIPVTGQSIQDTIISHQGVESIDSNTGNNGLKDKHFANKGIQVSIITRIPFNLSKELYVYDQANTNRRNQRPRNNQTRKEHTLFEEFATTAQSNQSIRSRSENHIPRTLIFTFLKISQINRNPTIATNTRKNTNHSEPKTIDCNRRFHLRIGY